MRFLVDNNLSPVLAKLLTQAGHDAVHVSAYDMRSSPDTEVMERARREDRIVLSADTDFGALLAHPRTTRPSYILLRGRTLPQPERQRDRPSKAVHLRGTGVI